MANHVLLSLWAVHISDGVLSARWQAGGFVVAGLLALLGAVRIRDEEIPRVALLTAAFFVAGLIGVPMRPMSVHLLLNGLVGIILGRRAGLAIPIGLFLQAALTGHGGFLAIGINTCVMAIPALLAWQLFRVLQVTPGLKQQWFLIGFIVGSVSVLATVALNSLVLAWGGQEDWRALAQLVFIAHLPIVAIEGIVLGFTVGFLVRVKPEMLGLMSPAVSGCPVESIS